MSFLTALSLSLNNLMTKKARTILTAFAGSIGIIGIALILSLSNGIQTYIDRVQEDTLSSYPLTIEAEAADLGSMVEALSGAHDEAASGSQHELDAVYSNVVMYDLMDSLNTMDVDTNNLKAFKEFIESGNSGLEEYVSAIQYGYDLGFDVYTMGLLTVMAISAGAFFLPFNSAPNLIFYATDRFTVAQELKGAIPLAILIVVGLIFSVLVWFPIIGIL